MKPIIQVENLNWSYDQHQILTDLTLSFESSRFYTIVGPNGSGKTTLLKNLLRHLRPNEETVFVNDQDLLSYKHKALAREMASVPQNTDITGEFTCFDIVLMGRAPYIGRFKSESIEDLSIVEEAMKKTDTWQFKDTPIQSISGGERQRVIISRAIAQNAKILLLDEPISNLDMHHQIDVLDSVKRLCLEEGITVITVLHDLNIASQYADEMIMMNKGQIERIGPPSRIMDKDLISKVYNSNFQIIVNPINNKPMILPLSQIGQIA